MPPNELGEMEQILFEYVHDIHAEEIEENEGA
jgi:hypothetical protein